MQHSANLERGHESPRLHTCPEKEHEKSALVLRRFLKVIDDQVVHGGLVRYKLQAELFLDVGKVRRRKPVTDRQLRLCASLRSFELEIEVVRPAESRRIAQGTIHKHREH